MNKKLKKNPTISQTQLRISREYAQELEQRYSKEVRQLNEDISATEEAFELISSSYKWHLVTKLEGLLKKYHFFYPIQFMHLTRKYGVKRAFQLTRAKAACRDIYDTYTGISCGIKGKVSVILPVYNQADMIEQSITSVLKQTYKNFELIILDDGSTDDIDPILRKYADHPKIKILRQKNQKLPAALNNAFKFATGEFYTWTSADNISLPRQLETLVEYLQKNPKKAMVFSDYRAIDVNGHPLKEPGFRPQNQANHNMSIMRLPDEVTEDNFHASGDNYIGASFMYRRDVAWIIGDYALDTFGGEDYDYWLRIDNLFDIGHVSKVLYKYRVHANTLNAKAIELNLGDNIRRLLKRDQLRRKYYKLGLKVKQVGIKYKLHTPTEKYNVLLYKYNRRSRLIDSINDRNNLNIVIIESPLSTIDVNFLKKNDIVITSDKKFFNAFVNDLGNKIFLLDLKNLKDVEIFKKLCKNRLFDKLNVKTKQTEEPQFFIKEKLNLAIQTNTMDKGGLEQVVANLVRNTDKEKFNIYLYINNSEYGRLGLKLKNEGYNVYLLRNSKKLLGKYLKQHSIDVVNLHYSLFGLDSYLKRKIRTTYTIHNSYTWMSIQEVKDRNIQYEGIDQFFAVSNQVKNYFLTKFNVLANKVTVIPNGLDLKNFKSTRIRVVNNLNLKKEDFVFINVATFHRVKFQNLMIAAIHDLAPFYPNFKLILVGNNPDQTYYKSLLSRIRRENLENQIKIVNYVSKSELAGLYTRANCFILPSIQEGWSNVIMEAMYFNLPLILSDVGSARDILEKHNIGIIIENAYNRIDNLKLVDIFRLSDQELPPNISSLKNAMLEIYENYAKWKRAASNGRKITIDHYLIDKMVNSYQNYYIRK